MDLMDEGRKKTRMTSVMEGSRSTLYCDDMCRETLEGEFSYKDINAYLKLLHEQRQYRRLIKENGQMIIDLTT